MRLKLDGVWAVVTNWNGGARNLDCVESLLAEGLAPERIVFVDNGSRDGSLELVKEVYPHLCFVENEQNEGFARGASVGAERAMEAGCEAVFFVNNDVTLLKDCIEPLLAVFEEEPRVGLVGPRVLFHRERSRVWSAGGRVAWRANVLTLLGHGKDDSPEWELEREVDFVCGCALLVRRQVLEEVGGFGAEWFAYFEDADLGLRARREGWSSRVVGRAACLHDASASTGGGKSPRRKYMMGLNSVWFLRAHGSPARWASFVLCDVLTLPLSFLAGLFTGQLKSAIAKALGILSGLSGRRVTAEKIEAGAGPLW
ncbi:MAG: glycosyltransferase family 2 protein [Planctomycetes bacterium]|nr:glycosyltransferase family 2 protein [Planctomycetota bacterium]